MKRGVNVTELAKKLSRELRKYCKRIKIAGEFTKKYVPIIYKRRGKVDINVLMQNSPDICIEDDLSKTINNLDGPKYGLNGDRWCNVTEGPCNCGAWHKEL